MQKRKLGNLEVSAIGVVGMGFSHGYGKVPEADYSINAMRKAFEAGCNFFDTAEVYGTAEDPHINEELVGKALAPYRDQVVISTKFGLRFDQESGIYPYPLIHDARPQSIRKAEEGSLPRLQTDQIAL